MSLTFQLIYSDGGETTPEDMWKLYSVALAPFVLGIPSTDVSLFLHGGFLNQSETGREMIERVPATSDENWFPSGYRDFFWEVYENASDVDQVALDTLGPFHFRLVSGHGLHDYVTGGRIICGRTRIPFISMGLNATVLTILDICNSPHAVACFSGTYPEDVRKFKHKRAFRDPSVLIPVACNQHVSTYAFRVGFIGQADDDDNEDNMIRMTGPFGDAVTCCVLAAVRDLIEQNHTTSLDHLFLERFKSLKTGYLPTDNLKKLKGYSSLAGLQNLIVNGSLQLNQNAFDCELFRRSNKWFLTTERATKLSSQDINLANCLITFVVSGVKKWHEENPNSMEEIEESRRAWAQLLQTLGPFSEQLRSIEFEFSDDGSSLQRSDDGLLFEGFAVSCSLLTTLLQNVHNWIATGNPYTGDDSDEE